jgi:hypothetical protein
MPSVSPCSPVRLSDRPSRCKLEQGNPCLSQLLSSASAAACAEFRLDPAAAAPIACLRRARGRLAAWPMTARLARVADASQHVVAAGRASSAHRHWVEGPCWQALDRPSWAVEPSHRLPHGRRCTSTIVAVAALAQGSAVVSRRGAGLGRGKEVVTHVHANVDPGHHRPERGHQLRCDASPGFCVCALLACSLLLLRPP